MLVVGEWIAESRAHPHTSMSYARRWTRSRHTNTQQGRIWAGNSLEHWTQHRSLGSRMNGRRDAVSFRVHHLLEHGTSLEVRHWDDVDKTRFYTTSTTTRRNIVVHTEAARVGETAGATVARRTAKQPTAFRLFMNGRQPS